MSTTSAENRQLDQRALTRELKHEARRLGFELVGATPAVSSTGITRFRQWLEAGYGGEMSYLSARADAQEHPNSVLEGVRSLLMLGCNYRTTEPSPCGPGEARVSRYAWGADYHDVMHGRLRRLADFLGQRVPGAKVRGVVDSAPLPEREFAHAAGLGWIGKNTLLLNRSLGSWFFLAALLTDVELAYDDEQESDHCGTCRACLDACPTGAFVDAYVLDARKCVSYTTIELRGPVDEELRPLHGEWLFGCDICQEVCPWNREVPQSAEAAFHPAADGNPAALGELFEMDEQAFRQRHRHTPLWRSKRRGILRNAALAAGGRRDRKMLPSLEVGLKDHEPLVRGACAWAIGRIGGAGALEVLLGRLTEEDDVVVRDEIERAVLVARGTAS